MDMKEKGIAYQRQNPYQDILMPKNTGVGFIVGGQAFVLVFAMVWHIWWMAIAAGLAMVITLIVRFSSDETERCIPAETVKRIEDERFRQLAEAQRIPTTGDTVSQPARLAYQE
jgi:cytochrome o ubiquinol oxidase subunit I